MRVIDEKNGHIEFDGNTGIGLGNFDGLHIGHMKLVNVLIEECRRKGIQSVIYTFSTHPEKILHEKTITPLITTIPRKVSLLKVLKLDCLYLAEFTHTLSNMTPEEFVKKILVEKFKIKLAVVGFDYRFGKCARGDGELLMNMGADYGFDVIVIPPVKLGNRIISSTHIRMLLSTGKVHEAARFLGRPYSMEGRVVRGRQMGSKLGFATANIIPDSDIIVPEKGVYITTTLVNGVEYQSITNVGNNPTFGLDGLWVETHMMEFDGDLYGQYIEVLFIKRIRNEIKFDSVDDLKSQVNRDITYAVKCFNKKPLKLL